MISSYNCQTVQAQELMTVQVMKTGDVRFARRRFWALSGTQNALTEAHDGEGFHQLSPGR
jgi:hypothetical protein